MKASREEINAKKKKKKVKDVDINILQGWKELGMDKPEKPDN